MANETKKGCLTRLASILGKARSAAKGNSLYHTEEGTSLYLRYSKRHTVGKKIIGFYGIRTSDLRFLQQQPKAACVFHTDDSEDLVFIPLPRILEYLEASHAAQDGMYKVQVYFSGVPEMMLAGAGRVGIGAFMGVPLTAPYVSATSEKELDRQHSLIQSKLKEIGLCLGHDVWIPRADRGLMATGKPLGEDCMECLDLTFPKSTMPVVENIDVLWLSRTRHRLEAMFEVEHTTTIYSGLLRLNDVIIDYDVPAMSIVTDANRYDVFARHVSRRTFEVSGLSKLCSHYTYQDVDEWHERCLAKT